MNVMASDSEQDLLQQLLQSPRLPRYAQEIDELLAAEARKRESFYEWVTADVKAEFINGQIIVHSPVTLRHNSAAGHLYRLLSTYVMRKGLGYVGYEKIMISLSRNDYEPDLCYFDAASAARFAPDQTRFPVPDLVVEVLSASTEHIDRGIKFVDYAVHGVNEYWLIDADTETIEQYRLQGEVYELAVKARTGELTSSTIPGFTIPVRAMFDQETNQETLRRLMQS